MIFITYNSQDLISKILFSTTYKGIGYINTYTRANTVIVWVARGIPSKLHVEHTGDLRKPTNLMGLATTVNLLHLDIRTHTNTHSCLPCCVELYVQPVFSCIRSVWLSQRQINDQTSATSLPWHTNKCESVNRMTVAITKITIAVIYILLCCIFSSTPIGHIFHYQKQGSDKWGTIMHQLSGLTRVTGPMSLPLYHPVRILQVQLAL